VTGEGSGYNYKTSEPPHKYTQALSTTDSLLFIMPKRTNPITSSRMNGALDIAFMNSQGRVMVLQEHRYYTSRTHISAVSQLTLGVSYYYYYYGSTGLCWGSGRFFSFLTSYTVGRTPSTWDHPVSRPLPTYTMNAHNTEIYALSGIRTHDPCVRASEDN
jgi:hypothetical protein